MTFRLPDPATPFGERVTRRLYNERLIWLTTVNAKMTPQPAPVWFLWDETTSTFLIYSRADAKRLEHLRHNDRIGLNFDGNGMGGDIIVFTGQADVSANDPPADSRLRIEKNIAILLRRAMRHQKILRRSIRSRYVFDSLLFVVIEGCRIPSK